MRSNPLLLLVAALLVVGCSADVPSPLVTTTTDAGGVDAAPDAPVALDDAAAGDAVANDGGDAGTAIVWQCSPAAVWINPQPAGVSGKLAFGAITADETTIAWVDGTMLHWADRAGPGDPWGNESSHAVPTIASSRLAISANGLHVVLVVDAGKNLGDLTRASKAGSFTGTPDSSLYGPIAFAMAEAPPQAVVDDPVLAEDEKHLFFTLSLPSASSTMREVTRADTAATWSLGSPLTQPELAPQNGALRRPTGLSGDRLTLFYWDEVDGAEHAAFRASELDDFTTFADLGARPGAQVDGTCTRLYYATPVDFERASRQ